MKNNIDMINAIVDLINSNIKLGSALYEDEKFVETIEGIEMLKYLLAKEYRKNLGVIDNEQ